jgi:hypothetical protein
MSTVINIALSVAGGSLLAAGQPAAGIALAVAGYFIARALDSKAGAA